MTSFAFVFPGQGSQSVGMLEGWDGHAAVAQTVEQRAFYYYGRMVCVWRRGHGGRYGRGYFERQDDHNGVVHKADEQLCGGNDLDPCCGR